MDAIISFMNWRLCMVTRVAATGSLALTRCLRYALVWFWHVEHEHDSSMGMNSDS